MGLEDRPRERALVVRDAYDAFARRDLERVRALLDRDVEWIQPDALPWGGVYRGPEQVVGFFAELSEYVEEASVEVDELLEADDHVVVLGRFRGRSRASREEFAVPLCHVWRVAGARVTWFRNFVDTAALLSALHMP